MNKDMPLQEAEEPMLSSEREDAFTRHPSIGILDYSAPMQVQRQTQFDSNLEHQAIKGEVRFLHWLKPVVSANRHL